MAEFRNKLDLSGLKKHDTLPLWWDNNAFKPWEGDQLMRIYPRIDSDKYISVTWGRHQNLSSTNPKHNSKYIVCGDRKAKFATVWSDRALIAAQVVDDDVDPEGHFQTQPPRERR